jgi:hypothetical protein
MIDWDKAVLGPVMAIFGESVMYQPASGASFSITGVFDEAYRGISLAGGTDVPSVMPVLGVRIVEFSAFPKRGDRLTVIRTNETFVLKEVEPDGHGDAKLLLNFVGS